MVTTKWALERSRQPHTKEMRRSQCRHGATLPSLFDPFAIHRSLALPILGRDPPSALSAAPFSSLLIAHGSKITTFNHVLCRHATTLTSFPAIDSLLTLSPSLAVAGATDFLGLYLLDPSRTGSPAPSPMPSIGTPSHHHHHVLLLLYRHHPGHRCIPHWEIS